MNWNRVIGDVLRGVRVVLDFRLFDMGDRPVTVSTLLIVAVVLFLAYRFSRIVQVRLARSLADRGLADEGGIAVGTRLAHYTIMVLGFGIGLETAGVDLSALFAASAVFAIGIGFAVQNVAQNFVSGIILMLEGAIKPGDVLRVQDQVVRVTKMGIRNTVAVNLDNIELIIPNSELVSSTVSNLSMSDRLVRIRVDVGVAYSSDIPAVYALLKQTAEAFPERAREREPVILLTGFGSSSVDFQVSVWTDNPWRMPPVATGVRLAIWKAFQDNGVTISFPQVDVHFDPEVVARIGRSAA